VWGCDTIVFSFQGALEVCAIFPRASGSNAVKPGEPQGKDLNPGTAISVFPLLRTYGLGEPAGRKIPLHYPRGKPRFGALFCAKTGPLDKIP